MWGRIKSSYYIGMFCFLIHKFDFRIYLLNPLQRSFAVSFPSSKINLEQETNNKSRTRNKQASFFLQKPYITCLYMAWKTSRGLFRSTPLAPGNCSSSLALCSSNTSSWVSRFVSLSASRLKEENLIIIG